MFLVLKLNDVNYHLNNVKNLIKYARTLHHITSNQPSEEIPLQNIEQIEENLNNFLETSAQTELQLVIQDHYHFVILLD